MNYWFLYTTATGSIYGSPYLGDATVWTNIPTGCAVLGPYDKYSASATVQDAFLHPSYYAVQSGQFALVANVDSIKLQEAKNAKISELVQKRDATLNSGFKSSAMGTLYTYSSDQVAQANFDGEFAFLNSVVSTDTTVDWYTWEAGMVTHTKAQFNQVYSDGRAFKKPAWTKFANLEKQVYDPTTDTPDKVNAIVW